MGNTSATLLIQKKGRLNATARGISAALGAVGCAGEEATLYRRENDRFYILCGAEPYPGPGGDALYALADAAPKIWEPAPFPWRNTTATSPSSV